MFHEEKKEEGEEERAALKEQCENIGLWLKGKGWEEPSEEDVKRISYLIWRVLHSRPIPFMGIYDIINLMFLSFLFGKKSGYELKELEDLMK
jgi:hypothetical protein